jgi:cyanophycinase-like exopeptidase
LVGSGEYLPQMETTDRMLLEQVGGGSARVVVLATAAGLEAPASPQRWTRMGVEHFARLGARAEPVGILVRDDAFDPQWLPLLEAADFIYFSGGSPQHVIQTLENSPAWDVVRARHAAGAALAGCSAGAMAFGALTLQPRALWRQGPGDGDTARAPDWYPALGLLGRAIVLPHFDRMASRMGRVTLALVAAAVPAGLTLIGVDEDTALVRVPDSLEARPRTLLEASGRASRPSSDGPSLWQVMGRQGVSVFGVDGEVRYAAGATVMLELDSSGE